MDPWRDPWPELRRLPEYRENLAKTKLPVEDFEWRVRMLAHELADGELETLRDYILAMHEVAALTPKVKRTVRGGGAA